MNDASIKVRMPADLLAALREQAEREDRPVGAILRLAAKQYLDKQRSR